MPLFSPFVFLCPCSRNRGGPYRHWISRESSSLIESPHTLRQTVYRNGYRPIPVPAGLKYPIIKAWTLLAREDPPSWLATEPTDERLTSTGILADGLRPLDIDVTDIGVA